VKRNSNWPTVIVHHASCITAHALPGGIDWIIGVEIRSMNF
jgi:hypothetical protein